MSRPLLWHCERVVFQYMATGCVITLQVKSTGKYSLLIVKLYELDVGLM